MSKAPRQDELSAAFRMVEDACGPRMAEPGMWLRQKLEQQTLRSMVDCDRMLFKARR